MTAGRKTITAPTFLQFLDFIALVVDLLGEFLGRFEKRLGGLLDFFEVGSDFGIEIGIIEQSGGGVENSSDGGFEFERKPEQNIGFFDGKV